MKFHLQKLLKKNLKKIKVKNTGFSLLMALGISSLVLGISYATVRLVTKSIERNASIERSNQVFYTAESGVEAAFFHHNARGAGTHFVLDGKAKQKIEHSEIGAEVYWKIDGRDNPLSGVVGENQVIQIPLFWDNSPDPSSVPNKDGKLVALEDFELTFLQGDIPNGFNFGHPDNQVLIDWSVLRKSTIDDKIQTFVPSDTSCVDGFICDDDLFTTGINSGNATAGKIYPGLINTNLNTFFEDGNSDSFQLKFQPILPFQDSSTLKKIANIPFSLEADDSTEMPKSAYTVTAEVSVGDYSRTIETVVPEKTSVGAFGYVIFD